VNFQPKSNLDLTRNLLLCVPQDPSVFALSIGIGQTVLHRREKLRTNLLWAVLLGSGLSSVFLNTAFAGGRLFIIGGGLRTSNSALFDGHSKFLPDEPISRQDAASVFLQIHLHNGGKIIPTEVALADEAEISQARHDSVFSTVRAGLLQTSDRRFRPKELLTRQEAAEAVYRILDFPWTVSHSKR